MEVNVASKSSSKEAVLFEPQPGPQTLLFQVPNDITTILFGGARGGGKTYGVLGYFLRHADSYGVNAKGAIFRKTFRELGDVINKAKRMFMESGIAQYNETHRTFKFHNGATLVFNYVESTKDAERYQGHNYTWICIEEAGNFASPVPLDILRATLRSDAGDVVKRFIFTANPGGPGNDWLRDRYVVNADKFGITKQEFKLNMHGKETLFVDKSVYIPARVEDNKILLKENPSYIKELKTATAGRDWLYSAWYEGNWDSVAGGMFSDVWDERIHVLPRFKVPRNWRVYRSFDWGYARPFSVGWWAVVEDDGVVIGDEYRKMYRGSLIRIYEWYGWTGQANVGLKISDADIVRGIKERDSLLRDLYDVQEVFSGPADAQIFAVLGDGSTAEKYAALGIEWEPAVKGNHSRVSGWAEMGSMLRESRNYPMESRGMFITEDCKQFKRIVPVVQCQPDKPDDINTRGEDHILDETRYMVSYSPPVFSTIKILEL